MKGHIRSATLKDVAARAGVSIKTVSNVVNGWQYVSDGTRQKVLKAINDVGYRPNHTARSLVTGKTSTIGVVIPDIANPFFGSAIRGCEDLLYERDYSLLLCNTNEDIKRERYYLDLLLSRGVDALILWGPRVDCQELESITSQRLPLVTVDLGDEPTSPNHTCINVDNVNGAFDATRHLISQGYTDIVHLAGPEGRFTAEQRITGFRKALDFHDIPFNEKMVVLTSPNNYGGYEAAKLVLNQGNVNALFCYNDLMALGALMAAHQMNIDVPRDLALMGFDDLIMASLSEPPLSTMQIDQYALGRLVGQRVLDRLDEKEDHPIVVNFPVQMQVRGSSVPQYYSPRAPKFHVS